MLFEPAVFSITPSGPHTFDITQSLVNIAPNEEYLVCVEAGNASKDVNGNDLPAVYSSKVYRMAKKSQVDHIILNNSTYCILDPVVIPTNPVVIPTITYIDKYLVTNSNQSLSFSVTIPSGATLCVLGITYWISDSESSNPITAITLDGQAGTLIRYMPGAAYRQSGVAYCFRGFGTGLKTFSLSRNVALVSGAAYMFLFFSGEDDTMPIRDSDTAYYAGGSTTAITTPAMDSSTSDIVVAIAGGYTADLIMTGGSQTPLYSGEFNSTRYGAAYKQGTGATDTATCTGRYEVLIGATIKAAPASTYISDGTNTELGTKFRVTVDGYITALRFYRSATNPGTNFVGHLWRADGTLLAQANFPTGTPAGWQQVNLTSPVPITANTTYVVSYYTTSGYDASRDYFTTSNQAAYRGTILYALRDGEEGGNGVYQVGGGFPTTTNNLSTNYFVDVVFSQPGP
jgi:hypothetical protein